MFKEFIDEVKSLYEKLLNNDRPFLDDFLKKWNIEGSIGEVYQNLCKKELKKEMGSFYTPYEIVDFMVDEMIKGLDYWENPFVKIVDPSCGGGYFLIAAFKKLVVLAEEAGIENPGEHVLKYNIYGYDIDENAVMITTLEIFNLTGQVTRNIRCQDFLMTDGEFDIVIGNPPYMGHKVLKGEYREKLCEIFQDVFQDKADLSYCFIKKSIDSLKVGGRLVFFTSRYILEALHGKGIREYIKNQDKSRVSLIFMESELLKELELTILYLNL
ncbi:HsdM family class I SAM-dependent methyltransferase [Fervidicella metallireducens]|uniref:HsdM family class I SAM-dependent methyltransferase n=1 Tax=Fervidicella metallireducens TaxID=655338 RepID=UPI000688B058|nr:SAM-dependent methyltransferase [Fervidicella metallireducens]